jgi:hypothetical protein
MKFFLGLVCGGILDAWIYRRVMDQLELAATDETMGRANISQPVAPVVPHDEAEIERPVGEPMGAMPDNAPSIH